MPTEMDPKYYHSNVALRDGGRVTIRAIRPDDKDALVELFDRLSPEAIYYRFHGAKKRLSSKELAYLTELDFHRQAALVAVLRDGERTRVVGVARYAVAPDGPARRAEIALTVEDALQGRGIGSLLFLHLTEIAREQGIDELEAYVLSGNVGMIRLLERSGRVLRRHGGSGSSHLVLTTAAAAPSLAARSDVAADESESGREAPSIP